MLLSPGGRQQIASAEEQSMDQSQRKQLRITQPASRRRLGEGGLGGREVRGLKKKHKKHTPDVCRLNAWKKLSWFSRISELCRWSKGARPGLSCWAAVTSSHNLKTRVSLKTQHEWVHIKAQHIFDPLSSVFSHSISISTISYDYSFSFGAIFCLKKKLTDRFSHVLKHNKMSPYKSRWILHGTNLSLKKRSVDTPPNSTPTRPKSATASGICYKTTQIH